MTIKRNILISAGPTREKIDPVRFITNYSSGKMGYALAVAARNAGHDVTLVSGPVSLPAPEGVKMVMVENAAEMAREIRMLAPVADIIIMAAAVADYRPVRLETGKIKKNTGNLILELERTEDILAELGESKSAEQILVGFAAETENLIDNAQKKLRKKNLDWIVANLVGQPESGFAVDQNAATMLSKNDETIDFPLQKKSELAQSIISTII